MMLRTLAGVMVVAIAIQRWAQIHHVYIHWDTGKGPNSLERDIREKKPPEESSDDKVADHCSIALGCDSTTPPCQVPSGQMTPAEALDLLTGSFETSATLAHQETRISLGRKTLELVRHEDSIDADLLYSEKHTARVLEYTTKSSHLQLAVSNTNCEIMAWQNNKQHRVDEDLEHAPTQPITSPRSHHAESTTVLQRMIPSLIDAKSPTLEPISRTYTASSQQCSDSTAQLRSSHLESQQDLPNSSACQNSKILEGTNLDAVCFCTMGHEIADHSSHWAKCTAGVLPTRKGSRVRLFVSILAD